MLVRTKITYNPDPCGPEIHSHWAEMGTRWSTSWSIPGKTIRIFTLKGAGTMSTKKANIQTILEIFRAVEHRDEQRVSELCQPDVEFCWPPSLPYGRQTRGLTHGERRWLDTWIPLQPTEAQRRMDPRVVAAGDDEVVVLWIQRGVSPAGDRFEGEVLGLYRLKDCKLARAQMFYFDTAALVGFLAKANSAARQTDLAALQWPLME